MDIYKMKLHDSFNDDTTNIHITRVPGGWIYNYLIRNYTVFIPYSDEFKVQTINQSRSDPWAHQSIEEAMKQMVDRQKMLLQ